MAMYHLQNKVRHVPGHRGALTLPLLLLLLLLLLLYCWLVHRCPFGCCCYGCVFRRGFCSRAVTFWLASGTTHASLLHVVETSTGCHDFGCNKLKSPKNWRRQTPKNPPQKGWGAFFLVTLWYWGSDLEPGMMYYPTKCGEFLNPQIFKITG